MTKNKKIILALMRDCRQIPIWLYFPNFGKFRNIFFRLYSYISSKISNKISSKSKKSISKAYLATVPILIFIFLLVFKIHFDYPFPYHIDEWHHITQTIKLGQGKQPTGLSGLEIGFHFLLLPLSKITDLVLIYKFLPALWAVFSALALFYLTYKTTNKNFLIAIFAILFFASIKSNVNLTGLWFFTPLTFAIPLIYLYFYFFTTGIQKQNKKIILTSLIIMLLLIPIHAISVLFSMPILLTYLLIYYRHYIKQEWKFFLTLIIIPATGLLFYKFIFQLPWPKVFNHLVSNLQFKSGWGILEIKNSFFEIYSPIGWFMAIVGVWTILILKNAKKYIIFIIWPIIILIFIFIFRQTGISYLAPYQRNLYYLALSLPILSAFGLYYLFQYLKKQKIIMVIFTAFIFLLAFEGYYELPEQVNLYQVIDQANYQALQFLKSRPKNRVMATPFVSTALFPVSGHIPVGTLYFSGHRKIVENFFLSNDCQIKQKIINRRKIKYIIDRYPMDCGWELIYNKGNYIYQTTK